MAIGIGQGRPIHPLIARLAQNMRAAGSGSLAAGAAAAGGAPGGNRPTAPSNKPKFHPLAVLKNFDPNKPLTGRDLARASRALTTLETRPLIHGYKSIINQTEQSKAAEDQGLSNLGTRLQGNVSDVYKNIAESEAKSLAMQGQLGQQLNQKSGEIAQQGTQNLAQMQTGALGDYTAQLQMRGAPGGGGAQQALAQAVASQQATQNADSQASQQFAATQGANSTQLLGGLAGAAQMQGGEAVAGIGRDILSRTAAANLKFNQATQEAREKLGEAKASYGPTFTKNLLALRGEQQKFKLGQEAVAGEKAKLGLAAKIAEEKHGLEQQKANAATTSANASAANAATAAWKAHHPNASSSEAAKQHAKNVAYVKEIRALIPQAHAAIAPSERNNVQTYNAYINEKAAAPPQIVRKVLQQWVEKKTAREHQGHTHR